MKRLFFGLLAIYCFSTNASSDTNKTLEIIRSGRTDHYAFKSFDNQLYEQLKPFIEKYGDENLVCYKIEAISTKNSSSQYSFIQLKKYLVGCEIDDRDLNPNDSEKLLKIIEMIPGTTTGNLVANNASAKIEGIVAESVYLKVFKIRLVSIQNDCKSSEDNCFITLDY